MFVKYRMHNISDMVNFFYVSHILNIFIEKFKKGVKILELLILLIFI